MQKCVQSTVLPPRVYGLLYFPVCVFIGRISFSIVDLIGSDSEGESLRRYATARRTPGSVATDRATTTKEESGNHKMVERAGFCAASYFPVKQNYSIGGFFSANRLSSWGQISTFDIPVVNQQTIRGSLTNGRSRPASLKDCHPPQPRKIQMSNRDPFFFPPLCPLENQCYT